MSQNFSFSAPPSGTPQQDQSDGQRTFLDMNSNGRLRVSGSDQVAGTSIPQMSIAQTAGIDLTQFPPALVAQVLQAIQMGVIPMPPPPPPAPETFSGQVVAPTATVQQAQPEAVASMPDWQGVKKMAQRQSVNGSTVQDATEDVNMDREDGEVEDGEIANDSHLSGFRHPPPTGPRARSQTPGDEALLDPYDPRGRDQSLSQTQSFSSSLGTSGQEDMSKDFVRQLHQAGYTFADLAKELGDSKSLRHLYHVLHLPIPAEQNAVLRASQSHLEMPKPSSKWPAPAKAPLSSDRTEYLKRLAAARNKAVAKNSTPPAPTVSAAKAPKPTSAMLLRQDAALPEQAGPSSRKPVSKIDEATAAAKRLLLKERLEALKAKQAAKLSNTQSLANDPVAFSTASRVNNVTNVANPSSPSIASRVLATTSPMVASSMKASSERSAVPSRQVHDVPPGQGNLPSPSPSLTPFRGLPGLQAPRLPGLPGLSGGTHLVPQSPIPNSARVPALSLAPNATRAYGGAASLSDVDSPAQTQDSGVLIKRAAGSDFEIPSAAPRRPFGASRHNSNTEQFIIHTSDDEEDDEEDMNQVAPVGNSSNGNLSKIEANMQKLKERIAAIELAKTSKSNVSTPGGSVVSSSDNGNGGAATVSNFGNKLLSHNISAKKDVSSQVLASVTRASLVASRETDTDQHHAPEAVASRPLEGLSSAVPLIQEHEDTNIDLIQDTVSSRDSPSSEDFYATEEHVSMPSNGMKDSGGVGGLDDETRTPTNYTPEANHTDNQESIGETRFTPAHQHGSIHELADEALPHDNMRQGQRSDVNDSIKAIEVSKATSNDDNVDDSATQQSLESKTSPSNLNSTLDVMDIDTSFDDDTGDTSSASTRNSVESDEDEYEPEHMTPEIPAMVAPSIKPPRSPTPQDQSDSHAPEAQSPLSQGAAAESSQVVPGGYKSLTYSNKIDPQLAFCPHESIGEKCNDPSCQWQHYEAAALNDNELLMSLGMTRPPVNSDEEKQKWKDGLGTLIKQLRLSKQGSDVNVIAAHICDYRRKFIGDDSKKKIRNSRLVCVLAFRSADIRASSRSVVTATQRLAILKNSGALAKRVPQCLSLSRTDQRTTVSNAPSMYAVLRTSKN
nr:protein red1 [Quercus suber]